MGIERRYRWKKRICRSTVVPGSGRSGQTGNGTYVTVSGTTLGPLRAPSTTRFRDFISCACTLELPRPDRDVSIHLHRHAARIKQNCN